MTHGTFADHRGVKGEGQEQAFYIDPVLCAAKQDMKIEILEQGIEAIENLLPGIELDAAAGPDMMKVDEMLHNEEKTNSGKVTPPLLHGYAGIKGHKVDPSCRLVKIDG